MAPLKTSTARTIRFLGFGKSMKRWTEHGIVTGVLIAEVRKIQWKGSLRPRDQHHSEAQVPIGKCRMIAKKHATCRTARRPTEIETASSHDFPPDRVGRRPLWVSYKSTWQRPKPILTPF